MNNFVNITSNDNWFKKHPEKIAGVEFETTSFYFPIQVKGTKEDVLRVTGFTGVAQNRAKKSAIVRVKKHTTDLDNKKLKLAKAKAAALKLKLQLQ